MIGKGGEEGPARCKLTCLEDGGLRGQLFMPGSFLAGRQLEGLLK